MREIVRKRDGGATLRGVLARLRTYSLTDGSADWLMSRQIDKPPKAQGKWVDGGGVVCISPLLTKRSVWGWVGRGGGLDI